MRAGDDDSHGRWASWKDGPTKAIRECLKDRRISQLTSFSVSFGGQNRVRTNCIVSNLALMSSSSKVLSYHAYSFVSSLFHQSFRVSSHTKSWR